MSIVAKCLFDAHYALTSANTEYTAPINTHTIIDKFTVTNYDTGAQTITINLIPSGGSVANSNVVTKALSIAAGATTDIPDVKNHILNPGDAISVTVSAGSLLIIRGSGREVT